MWPIAHLYRPPTQSGAGESGTRDAYTAPISCYSGPRARTPLSYATQEGCAWRHRESFSPGNAFSPPIIPYSKCLSPAATPYVCIYYIYILLLYSNTSGYYIVARNSIISGGWRRCPGEDDTYSPVRSWRSTSRGTSTWARKSLFNRNYFHPWTKNYLLQSNN